MKNLTKLLLCAALFYISFSDNVIKTDVSFMEIMGFEKEISPVSSQINGSTQLDTVTKLNTKLEFDEADFRQEDKSDLVID